MRRLTLLLTCTLLAVPGGTLAQDLPESSPQAIAAHAEGLRAYLAQDYRAAIPHFLRAHELDPTFYVPLFVAALNAGNAGMTATADSLWDVVAKNRSHFSDYYQRLIDIYVMRRNGGDWAKSMELARSVAMDYPGTKANYNYALWSNSDGRPREALEALTRLDPDKEPMKGWFSYFAVKCNALHWVGDYAGELQCARDAVQRFPDRGAAHYFVAEALAAQGRGPEASEALEEALKRPEKLAGYSPGAMHGALGLEMLTHGCGEDIADGHLAKAVAFYEALPADEAEANAMRRQQAFWLYANGDYQKAYQKLQDIDADLGSIWDKGYLGVTAALAGNRTKAEEVRTAFLAGEITPRAEVQHYWAALLSAALDERDAAAAHFKQTWSNVNSHAEPVLLLKMGSHPAFQEYVKPRG
ncbi:MAG TPA: hypothetical protein VLA36_11355 [Longimicrobiales bacterium]|nr:hypothetical protein [Longimicrobiales bacterium]